MALLDIILEGDPRLRQKATRIRSVDDGLRRLAADMHETMLAAPGVGLAAPQVGITRRLIVVHVPENYDEEGTPETTLTLVNPEIVKSQGRVVGQEGCLSIPGWVGDVPPADLITVKAIDLDNKPTRLKASGILARVLQHEIDHLDGILYVDLVEDKSTLLRVPEDEEVEGPVPDESAEGRGQRAVAAAT
ncbi:MAG: peptide deformylase [Chloroflexota bacterium]|nr:peptide deformylase [Chloroflexota bacterium]